MKYHTKKREAAPWMGVQEPRWSICDESDIAVGVAYSDETLAERVVDVLNGGETNLSVAEEKAQAHP